MNKRVCNSQETGSHKTVLLRGAAVAWRLSMATIVFVMASVLISSAKSQILVCAFVATASGLLPIQALLQMTNIGTLFAFAIVCLAVLIMRRKNPGAHRPFPGPRYAPGGRCSVTISVLHPSGPDRAQRRQSSNGRNFGEDTLI